MRYETIKIKRRPDGKRVYATVYYPEIKKKGTDIYIITKATDTLDALAHKYYKDVHLYWIIARANNLGKGTRHLEPGIQIRIPIDINDILFEFESLNRNA